MFSYELRRLEMTDALNKIEVFFISLVRFQTMKAALLYDVIRILGSFCLVALPSQILMVLDGHHHCVNNAGSRKEKDVKVKRIPLWLRPRSWLQLAHISLDSLKLPGGLGNGVLILQTPLSD